MSDDAEFMMVHQKLILELAADLGIVEYENGKKDAIRLTDAFHQQMLEAIPLYGATYPEEKEFGIEGPVMIAVAAMAGEEGIGEEALVNITTTIASFIEIQMGIDSS